MNQIIFLCSAIAFSSLLVGTLVYCLAFWLKKIRYWPTIWAIALLTIASSSLLAFVLFLSPEYGPALAINLGSHHAPLGPNDVMQWSAAAPSNTQGTLLSNAASLTTILYLSGVGLFLLRLLNGRRRALKIAKCATQMHTLNGVEYWVTEAALSPFAIRRKANGKRHQIVIPSDLIHNLSRAELGHILRHELAHTQRRDDECGLLLRTVVALTWFTPISHLLFSNWAQSIEMQCDLDALSNAPVTSRRSYAHTLLKTLKLTLGQSSRLPVAAFSGRHMKNEKRRLTAILKGDERNRAMPHTLFVILSAGALTFGSAIFMSANAGADCDKQSSRTTSNNDFKINGRISSKYGHERDPFKTGEMQRHNGVDIAAPLGTTIYSPATGTIIAITDNFLGNPRYGKVMVLETDHNTRTVLAHLQSYKAKEGQRINAGQAIATVGKTGASTGPHVHIETYVAGNRVDPASVWSLNKN